MRRLNNSENHKISIPRKTPKSSHSYTEFSTIAQSFNKNPTETAGKLPLASDDVTVASGLLQNHTIIHRNGARVLSCAEREICKKLEFSFN